MALGDWYSEYAEHFARQYLFDSLEAYDWCMSGVYKFVVSALECKCISCVNGSSGVSMIVSETALFGMCAACGQASQSLLYPPMGRAYDLSYSDGRRVYCCDCLTLGSPISFCLCVIGPFSSPYPMLPNL